MGNSSQSLPALKPPARVGLFSPAGCVQREQVQPGIHLLNALGFSCHLANHAYNCRGLVSGTIGERLSDIQALLAEPDIQALWCLRGGYGSIQLLGDFPYESLQTRPRWLIGFSDITALQWAVYQRTGLPSLSGFTLTSQFRRENPFLEAGLEILAGERCQLSEADLQGIPIRAIRPGKARGILLGGTLAMIVSLAGTPFFPQVQPLILFLEDVNEPLYRIDRYLWQLHWMGFWPRVAGVVLGRFTLNNQRLSVLDLLAAVLPDGVPVVADFPYGHFQECCPLPLGVEAELQVEPFRLRWNPICRSTA
ncbi:MAG: LD-carboxypeptidase [Calditrichaeota bacterium]|nr:MAG: LD-carboxypeptidase [Calditrichota bacterium]